MAGLDTEGSSGCIFLSQELMETGMFHLGFSGARQALSAIMLSSSESLPRAVRHWGAWGLLLPSQPTCCQSYPGEALCSPPTWSQQQQASYLTVFFQLTPDLCSSGRVPCTPPEVPGEGPSLDQGAHLSNRHPLHITWSHFPRTLHLTLGRPFAGTSSGPVSLVEGHREDSYLDPVLREHSV